MPRADPGEGARGLGHLLNARGLGDPTRTAMIGVPEHRSLQSSATGADHPLHVCGLQLPERPVAAESLYHTLRLPSETAQCARCLFQDVPHGVLVGGNEVKPAARPPHVPTGDADRAHQLLELADQFAPANELLFAPRHRVPDRETGAVDRQSIVLQLRQTADQVVRGKAALSDRAARGQRFADQVGYGLRLPGAGRPLDHQVAALDRVQDGERLRAVRVHHRMETRHSLGIVDVLVFADVGRPLRESVAAEELLHQRVVGRPASFRPGLRIQVLVDEQLAEGEEVQVDLVVLDRPALPSRDRLLDPEQIVFHVEIFLGRHLRQADTEVLFELGLEREVRLDIVPGPLELEALPHAGPVELNRDQDQRRAARGAAALGLVPPEHPKSEIEDVDPLFLDREASLTEGLAQAQIERGSRKRGLELVVGVACGGFVGVVVRLAEHGEEFGGDVVEVVRGRFAGCRGRRLPGRGKEVHDPRASGRGSLGRGTAHEDPEQLARPLIHDLDAAPLRGTEVEQRVPEGEIEDVAAGFLELLPDGGEVGHVPEPAR